MDLPKRCADCPHMKSRSIGYVSTLFWCGLVGNGWHGTSLGIRPWYNRRHPKCHLTKNA